MKMNKFFSLKIALIGYGKMGKELENLIKESGTHQVVSIARPGDSLDKAGIKKADVAIDFSSPEVVVKTIGEVMKLGTRMVVGTTGWYDDLPKVKALVKKHHGGLVYGSNFSIGANIFFQMVGFACKLLGKFPGYDVAGLELHHTGKKDSPSGTAKKLASIILENFPKKKKLETARLDRQITADELHFASVRIGQQFGFHEILFDSVADEIKMSHNAHSRRGFAEGALLAAEFIKGKKGFYSFEEILRREG